MAALLGPFLGVLAAEPRPVAHSLQQGLLPQELPEENRVLAQVAELTRLSLACETDPEAARELIALLMLHDERLRAGETLDPRLLANLHVNALTVPFSCLAEGARELDDFAAWALAERAANAYPDAQGVAEYRAMVVSARSARVAGNDPQLALEDLELALAQDPVPVRERARLELERGEILRYLRRWQEAEEALRAAEEHLPVAPPENQQPIAVQGQLTRARLEHDLGRIEHALAHFEAAREAAGDVAFYAQPVQLEQAVFLLTTERFQQARQLLEGCRAEDFPDELRGAFLLRRGLVELLAARAGETADLAAGEGDLLAVLGLSSSATDQNTARLQLARLELGRGNLAVARRHLDALRAATPPRKLTPTDAARLAFLDSVALRRAGAPRAALEEARALLLGAHQDLLALWRELPVSESGVGFLHFGIDCDSLGELLELELVLESPERGAERALGLLAEAQAHGTLTRRLGLPPLDALTLRKGLAEDELVLVYFFAPDQGRLFLLQRERVQAFSLPGSTLLRRPMAEFRGLASAPPGGNETQRARRASELARLGAELGAELLPSVVRPTLAAAKHVTVIGIDMLGGFPLEALPYDAEGRVGSRLALDHGLSLPLFGAREGRRAARGPGDGTILALLAPSTQSEAQIPFERADQRAFEQAWKNLRPWNGAEATKGRWNELARSGALARARALLVLAHGIRGTGRELPAGIRLAGPEREDALWHEDIVTNPAPEILVLGVCNAGSSSERRGEDGAADLGGAGLRAGALAVVCSPHALEARATQRQLLVLGKQLGSGKVSLAEAMRAARAAEGSQADPFYAQLLRVIGDGR